MKTKTTQKELADYLGVHETFISLILNDNRRIGLKLAETIKRKCGMSYDYILETEPRKVFDSIKRTMEEE